MLLVFFLIQLCLGKFEFLSPQELVDTEVDIGVTSIGNPAFLNTYAKLVYFIESECALNGPFSDNEFALIYLSSATPCDLIQLAKSAQNKGASGIIIAASKEISNNTIYVFDYSEEGAQIKIPMLFISKSLGKTLKNYANQEVIIKYNYKNFLKVSNPKISIIFSSNYTQDKPFIESLKGFIDQNDGYLYLKDIGAKVHSLNTGTYDNKTCIYYDNTSFVCSPSADTVTGVEKLQNTAVILNFFKSLNDISMIKTFFEYLSELYTVCAKNYSIECNKNVLLKYGSFNDDVSSLTSQIKNPITPPMCQIDEINILWSDYVKDAYCLTKDVDSEMCGIYSGTCTYSMLMENSCISQCNNKENNYGNLVCLKEDTCYSFLLNNGQCEKSCPNDPDCDKSGGNDDDDLLLVKILVPIFGVLLL